MSSVCLEISHIFSMGFKSGLCSDHSKQPLCFCQSNSNYYKEPNPVEIFCLSIETSCLTFTAFSLSLFSRTAGFSPFLQKERSILRHPKKTLQKHYLVYAFRCLLNVGCLQHYDTQTLQLAPGKSGFYQKKVPSYSSSQFSFYVFCAQSCIFFFDRFLCNSSCFTKLSVDCSHMQVISILQ